MSADQPTAQPSPAATLGAEEIGEFLRAHDVVPRDADLEAHELGWGVSNVVLKVIWRAEGRSGCAIVKQSLPALRVAADWRFDRARTFVERDCLLLLARLVPGAVPEVLICDERRYLLAISCVPAGGVLWKQALLDGDVDLEAAGRAGELLGRIHRLATCDRQAQARFADQTVLVQGRTDPYHMTAAAAHPELAPSIEAEVRRMLATRLTLTLGDYSPKNIFVYSDRVIAIDFETAHWGDPAFDVAFCLTNLSLKAYHLPGHTARLVDAAARFWTRYRDAESLRLCSEQAVVSELGCLLLARIDGKSPVEYIVRETVKERVRALAASLILDPGDSVSAALERVRAGALERGEDGAAAPPAAGTTQGGVQ